MPDEPPIPQSYVNHPDRPAWGTGSARPSRPRSPAAASVRPSTGAFGAEVAPPVAPAALPAVLPAGPQPQPALNLVFAGEERAKTPAEFSRPQQPPPSSALALDPSISQRTAQRLSASARAIEAPTGPPARQPEWVGTDLRAGITPPSRLDALASPPTAAAAVATAWLGAPTPLAELSAPRSGTPPATAMRPSDLSLARPVESGGGGAQKPAVMLTAPSSANVAAQPQPQGESHADGGERTSSSAPNSPALSNASSSTRTEAGASSRRPLVAFPGRDGSGARGGRQPRLSSTRPDPPEDGGEGGAAGSAAERAAWPAVNPALRAREPPLTPRQKRRLVALGCAVLAAWALGWVGAHYAIWAVSRALAASGRLSTCPYVHVGSYALFVGCVLLWLAVAAALGLAARSGTRRARLCALLTSALAVAAQGAATGASAAFADRSTHELECAAAYGHEVWQGCVRKVFGCGAPAGAFGRAGGADGADGALVTSAGAPLPCGCAELDLTSRGLAELPPGVLALGADLRALSLGNNSLASLPDALGAALGGGLGGGLLRLDISRNLFAELPSSVLELTHLVTLDASANGLGSLPTELGRLSSLRELDVSENAELDSLPAEALGQLRALAVLRAARARLSSLPASLASLPKLQVLDASHNRLTALPAGLLGPPAGAPSIAVLLLSHNQLTALSDDDAESAVSADEPTSALRLLHASSNQLRLLPPALLGRLAGSLEVLDVADNQLADLADKATLQSMEQLTVVAAGGNPLSASALDALNSLGARGVSVGSETRAACEEELLLDWSPPCAADGSAGAAANSSLRVSNETSDEWVCPDALSVSTYCVK